MAVRVPVGVGMLGMGVPGVRVDQPEDLAGALAEAFADGGPRLVEIGIEGKR